MTGVTGFLHGEVRFLSLDQWVDEYRNYEKLRTIPFFFRFKKTKVMNPSSVNDYLVKL